MLNAMHIVIDARARVRARCPLPVSAVYLCKAVLPHMAKGGSIINTSSVAAYKGRCDMIDCARPAAHPMQCHALRERRCSADRHARVRVRAFVCVRRHGEQGRTVRAPAHPTPFVHPSDARTPLHTPTRTHLRSVAFTYSLAQSPEVLAKSIRVNAVAPGPTWSPIVQSTYSSEKAKAFGQDTPMGRPAQPEEIAPSYVFLASEVDSSYMSGQVLHPNGGIAIHG
jgi:NAD(P)-dependent dehydrogenase (short-subunit alcohol dehydrogenase family)